MQEKLVIERRMREAAEAGEPFRCPKGVHLIPLPCFAERQTCFGYLTKLSPTSLLKHSS